MSLTNVKNVHPLIAGFVEGQSYSPKINRIGVTTLIGPPLVRQLRFRFHKHIISDVSEYLWAFFGTSFHRAMESNKIPGWVYEVKGEKKFGKGYPDLVGYMDAYNFLTKELVDFKVTSVWSIIYGLKDGKPEWDQQTNIYAYLLNLLGMDVKELNIIAILRDWQASKAEQEKDYPSSPFYTHNIKLSDKKSTEEFVKYRMDLHMKPGVECTPEEKWIKPTMYAAKKKANKTASGGKVTDSLPQAEKFIASQKDPSIWEIDVRKGEATKCLKYCGVRTVCPFSPCFDKKLYDSVMSKK